MNVLVTGGSGFLGHEVIPRLCAAGHAASGPARTGRPAAILADLGARPVRGFNPRSFSLGLAEEAALVS